VNSEYELYVEFSGLRSFIHHLLIQVLAGKQAPATPQSIMSDHNPAHQQFWRQIVSGLFEPGQHHCLQGTFQQRAIIVTLPQ
jgi:hypothetical protein